MWPMGLLCFHFTYAERILSFNFLCNTLFYWLKNWGDFVSPEKIDLWRICSNVAEHSSAIGYSAETNHGTCKVLLDNIYVFDVIK
jgi:hypothetical protein